MKDEMISYFKPITGTVVRVEGQEVFINLGAEDSVKPGMRFRVTREGAPFIHPVTKKPLGRLETTIGDIDIKEVDHDSSMGTIATGEVEEGDKVRISEIPVRLLFWQSENVEWHIADTYHRDLKETGRFYLIDTDIETDDPQEVIKEAKRHNAEVALLLTSKKVGADVLYNQRLFWVSDGLEFAEMDAKIDTAYAKELRFGDEFFMLPKKEASVEVDLPLGARLLTVGDIDGDGKQELLLSTGKDIKIYVPGADLQPALGGLSINESGVDVHLWIDTVDLNGNGKDEIVVTAMKRKVEAEDVFREGKNEVTLSSVRSGGVVSTIYELKDSQFVLLFTGNIFLRKMEKGLIAQTYSKDEGFSGDVFDIIWEGAYKMGDPVELPDGVNIYDFLYIHNTGTDRLILTYDDKGFLNLYDNDIRVWRSENDTGGFLSTFKKTSPSMLINKGEWAIKDRLFLRNNEVLFVERTHFLDFLKGLGYKSSLIKNVWWNGVSMEEGILVDEIKGTIIDYTVIGDTLMVLASPRFGIKAGNILKGENPLGLKLHIYSLKGR